METISEIFKDRKKRRFWLIVICCTPVAITASIFIGRFVLQSHVQAREYCRYISDMNQLSHQLNGYLQRYYKDHGCYPEKLDISQIKALEELKYRTASEEINYSTDGNSFEIGWKYTTVFGSEEYWTVKGLDGKRIYSDIESIKER